MKRLLLVIALVLLPLTASAQLHDALLTPGGTLFAVEIERSGENPEVVADGSNYFVLIARSGEETTREVVPATLINGRHSDPAIAYDGASGMLFLFWLRHAGLIYNELLVATRDSAGAWSEPTAIGQPWDFRENLRIAVTRKVDDPESGTQFAGVTAHAAWWEFDSATGRESARYAMLTIDNGVIAEVNDLDLGSFIEAPETAAVVDSADGVENAVLMQPLIQTSPMRDSVLVTFGDLVTQSLHQVSVRPTKIVVNGRLRVPIGRKESIVPSPQFDAASDGRVEAVYGGGDRLALYVRGADKLEYVVYADGVWSESRSIAYDADITSGAALDAVRRLVHEH